MFELLVAVCKVLSRTEGEDAHDGLLGGAVDRGGGARSVLGKRRRHLRAQALI